MRLNSGCDGGKQCHPPTGVWWRVEGWSASSLGRGCSDNINSQIWFISCSEDLMTYVWLILLPEHSDASQVWPWGWSCFMCDLDTVPLMCTSLTLHDAAPRPLLLASNRNCSFGPVVNRLSEPGMFGLVLNRLFQPEPLDKDGHRSHFHTTPYSQSRICC